MQGILERPSCVACIEQGPDIVGPGLFDQGAQLERLQIARMVFNRDLDAVAAFFVPHRLAGGDSVFDVSL